MPLVAAGSIPACFLVCPLRSGAGAEFQAVAGAGARSIFQLRPSCELGASKPRPLYAKLDVLLDLVYRRLFWDPAQPAAPFSQEALLWMIRCIDKDLGP
jgi:hypothetical protein